MDSLISVIIPTYKRAPYIKRAIQSVIHQTYSNVELIIVDDNGDGTVAQKETEESIRDFIGLENIIYIKHAKNLGGSAARNTGIKSCHGEYITFLDDDDFFIENRFDRIIKYMKNENVKIAYSACIFIWNGRIKNVRGVPPSEDPMLDMLCVRSFMGTGSNMVFHKSIFEKILFDESFSRHQDFEFMLRALEIEHNRIGYDDYPSVIKEMFSSSNIPNPTAYLQIKQKYLDTFSRLINTLYADHKNEIFWSNYVECYKTIILSHDKDTKKFVKDKIKEYGSFTILNSIVLFMRQKILSSKVFGSIIVSLYSCFQKNKIEKDIKKYIKKIV